MTSEKQDIIGLANSHIEVLVDRNCRKSDGIVKPLNQWCSADLLHLMEILKEEIKEREETRPFWV